MSNTQAVLKSDEYEEFAYISEKILDAPFSEDPFRHVLIEELLSPEHLQMLVEDPQIMLDPVETTEELLNVLGKAGYEVIPFPGCTTDIRHYLRCLQTGKWPVDRDMLEGFGIAMRLKSQRSPDVKRLLDYLTSPEFHSVLERKFAITRKTRIDTGIQKYLTGYEISPHPDIRSKCLTYLVNINTTDEAERLPIHTYLLKFKPEKEYIYSFWENNEGIDRCWVPWDWCTVEKTISQNNSLILFETHDRSLHAVKLDYDHTKFQRTQIYGNLWYTDQLGKPKAHHRDLEIKPAQPPTFFERAKRKMTAGLKRHMT